MYLYLWILLQTVLLGVHSLDCDNTIPTMGGSWPELPTSKNLLLNREAELMAMEATGSLLPDRTLVHTIKTDLQAIRSSFPVVGNTSHRRKWAAGRLRLNSIFNSEDIRRINQSEYGPIRVRQINPRYRVAENILNITYLNFPLPYNPIVLSDKLFDLLEIRGDVVRNIFTDGDDVVYNGPNSYTFIRGSGRCFISCEQKQFWNFVVECNKNVTLTKEYSVTYSATSLLDFLETFPPMR